MKNIILLTGSLTLAACGTTYKLPEISSTQTAQAEQIFAEAKAEPAKAVLSNSAAERRFRRVAARIEPVGRSYCETLTKETPGTNCAVDVALDREMEERNAYFTYKGGQPLIRVSLPLVKDTRNDDELAFVLGHEYGHLIGKHTEKQQQQALAGALIVGVIAGAVAADSGVFDSGIVEAGVGIGAAAGTYAYSQSFELESDTLGTRIADSAGYDAVTGAKFFAKPEDVRTSAGKLSFWGTHPPDAKRLATVLATADQIDTNVGLQRVE